MKTLKDLFLKELVDRYGAKRQLVEALPGLARVSTCPALRKAIEFHYQESAGHVLKLERVFRSINQPAHGKTCTATVGLLAEGAKLAADYEGSPAINAALICVARKIEHYEMAAYGCLHEWASLLGNYTGAALVMEILGEEKIANQVLTELARNVCNETAMGKSVPVDSSKSWHILAAPKQAGPRQGARH